VGAISASSLFFSITKSMPSFRVSRWFLAQRVAIGLFSQRSFASRFDQQIPAEVKAFRDRGTAR
jgi:hypothetical protein